MNLIRPAALALCTLFSPLAAAQDGSPATAYIQADTGGQIGQGFFLSGTRGCVLVTAGHVGKGTDRVHWWSEGVVGTGHVAVSTVDEAAQLDIGIIDEITPAPARCPTHEGLMRIPAAISQRGSEIFKVTPTGRRPRIEVSIIDDTPELVVRPIFADEEIKSGTSGAPVRVAGIVVGVVRSVDNRGANPVVQVQRLDRVPQAVSAWLGAPVAKPAAVRRPFDEALLPQNIRTIVQAAQDTRKEAESAAKEARRIEAEADKAAAIASGAGPTGDPYRTFVADSEVSEYSGMIKALANGGARASSYGISKSIKGDAMGRQVKCIYSFLKQGNCDGPGVVVFEEKSSWARWEGFVCASTVFCGPGVLRLKSGDIWYYDPPKARAGVVEQLDAGNRRPVRYQGIIANGNWEGEGVLWYVDDGSILRTGTWKSGQPIGAPLGPTSR